MFYCHHSTGLGHLVRSLAVVGELARFASVTLCVGGRMPPGLSVPAGVELLALPAIGTEASGRLVGSDGRPEVQPIMRERGRLLIECFEQLQPDALVLELFPFGRRKFAAELLPLLERARSARPVPVIVSSVRDLLVSGHPDKLAHDEVAARRLDAYFDAVVVHGDPRFAELSETFRPIEPARVPVYYSGFVVGGGNRAEPSPGRDREVVVSAGGGAVGHALFDAAVQAHQGWLRPQGFRTRIITGPFLPAADLKQLSAISERDTSLTVQRFVPDLRPVLARSAVSVSQAGYNTALDLLVTRTPAVVVPYGDARENEQPERARRLARLGAVQVLEPAELSGPELARRVLSAATRPPHLPELDLDGAVNSARIIAGLLAQPNLVAS